MARLANIVDELESPLHPELTGVILTGDGTDFCAGSCLRASAAGNAEDDDEDDDDDDYYFLLYKLCLFILYLTTSSLLSYFQ